VRVEKDRDASDGPTMQSGRRTNWTRPLSCW